MVNQQPPLYLQPEVSRQLSAFLLTSHVLASGVVVFMPAIPGWGKCLLLLAVVFSGIYFWRLHVSRSLSQAVLDVTFYNTNNCLVRTNTGSVFAVLDDSSFLHPWLCVLNLRTRRNKVHTLILLNDALPADTLRQLRVRVKFSVADAEKTTLPGAKGRANKGSSKFL